MEKVFSLKKNGTRVRTEILAGLTTFMTMAYIIALNPNLLTNFGANGGMKLWNGVFLATCLASAVGMFCMAFLANKPFAMAPGMGINTFFATVVGEIVGITGLSFTESYQAALCIILVEGIVFTILSFLSIREKIVTAIPYSIRMGIAPAMGLMLLDIGLGSNAGIFSDTGGPYYVMRDFFGSLSPASAKNTMGSGYLEMCITVNTMLIGLLLIVVLARKRVKAAVLIGMLGASGIFWASKAIFMHVNPFDGLAKASWLPPFSDMVETTLFKFNFSSFIQVGWFTAITLVITFCMI
ncbi:MAG: solute carrier family 23 protein, partial [Lachnospiraceae bacterium]